MQSHSRRAREWAKLAMEKYMDMVYRLAYAKLGNQADAEDVTQNVMLKLLSCEREIQTEEHLKRWLIRVTANESVNLFRSAWRRRTLPLEETRAEGVLRDDEQDELEEALRTLAKGYRVVVHLFYYEGMSTKEIAEILGLSPGTVRERLHRARRKLKQQLSEKGGDYFV